MRSARGQNEIAVYTIRVERRKLDQLREIAHAEHRDLAGEFRRMIDERIGQPPSGLERRWTDRRSAS